MCAYVCMLGLARPPHGDRGGEALARGIPEASSCGMGAIALGVAGQDWAVNIPSKARIKRMT